MQRTFAAVLIADVAGYTRLMEGHEIETHTRLMQLLDQVIEPSIAAHGGTIARSTGDGFLSHFSSIDTAVQCAVGIQQEIGRREGPVSPEQRIAFRMGLAAGEILIETRDIYGTEVNVAARLQELSEPGGIVTSAAVRERISGLKLAFVDLGKLLLKNIASPVRAFRLVQDAGVRLPLIQRPTGNGRPSVAVLPFRVLDNGPEKAYFGECMVEDIIASLATLRELRVISRNSTLSYGGNADVAQVGADLGVRYILSGTIRRGPQRDRIVTELADTDNRTVLWAHAYDTAGEDLFAVQDRIATQIVGTIAPRVRDAEIRRSFQKRPENLEAYDYVLQAMHLLFRLGEEEFMRAGTLLRRAIALDDTYSTAYELAAHWHLLRAVQGWSPDLEADNREGLRLAQTAVDLDSSSGPALAQLGHLKSFIERDYDAALELLHRAVNVCPGSAWVWGLSAPTYNYVGDGTGAIVRAEHAISLSPQDTLAFFYHTSLCIAHYTNGDYQQAVQWGEIAVRENPRYTAAMRHTIAAHAALGQMDAAAEVARNMLEIDPGFHVAACVTRYPYRDVGLRERLRRHLLAAGLPP